MPRPAFRSALRTACAAAAFLPSAAAGAQSGGAPTAGAQPVPAAAAPAAPAARPAPADSARVERLKTEASRLVDSLATFSQRMVDQVFSYGELGFQEVETARHLVDVLRRQGFRVETGVSGVPTAWVARWGTGGPVIALGSDVDGIPQASQTPGVAYRKPLVAGAPGHGEGHNAGVPLNVTAAVALKRIMERERLPGTIVLWPGTAEELVAGKAYFVRDGLFRDVDAVLFTHVGSDFSTSWGGTSNNGLVSVEYRFRGDAAHAAGTPWRGRSALDAVALMDVGWNFRREHLRLQQRSHYVIPDGGDQPNVVPSTASVWFYFRERDYERTRAMFDEAKKMAQGAAMLTGTQLDTVEMVGSGWSGHFSRPVAEAMYQNIQKVGMPAWDERDQTLAKGIQRELGVPDSGLTAKPRLNGPIVESQRTGGGSDDIGDVSWNVPTINLNFPSNIPNLPGHHWANAISMATPIAHKGVVAGAKVQAMTMLDILLEPKVVADAWDYFNNVQTKTVKYKPFFAPTDKPPIWLNADIMARYRPAMRKFYYDPKKYGSYLEQLGITYPTVRPATPATSTTLQ